MARTVAVVSRDAEDALLEVAAAKAAYVAAEAAYRAACVKAHGLGANYNAIARAAEVTPQTARQIVQRATS